MPEQLFSDNGSGFVSAEFREFPRANGIHHTFTSPYHSSANGLAEQSAQIIKKALDSYMEGEMTTHLNWFLMRYLIIPHSTTGIPPSELLMGRRIHTTLIRVFPSVGQKAVHK